MNRAALVDNIVLVLQLLTGLAQYAYLKHRIAKVRSTEREA